MYQATKDISSRIGGKKAKTYCLKGDLLLQITDSNPLIVATKKDIFSVNDQEIKKADMNPHKLIDTIKEVANNPQINDKTFPYPFVKGITEGKEWEEKFVEELKRTEIQEEIKTKLLKMYETASI